jgi:hypothetical protein
MTLETYLGELHTLRNTGVAETSHYPALKALLDEAGSLLSPSVVAINHPKSSGAGLPDLGLFDQRQTDDPTKPSRGVVEVKGIQADLIQTAQSDQVRRYLAHYGQVLVTNLYQFVLVTRDDSGAPVLRERFDLAPNPDALWKAEPRTLARTRAFALDEYLQRVMLHSAPLTTPKDVAAMLASYARVAKARIDAAGATTQALDTVREQMEKALGVTFEDAAAKEFFKSTLIQTLFYGVFSAWVLWHERSPFARFELWRDTRELRVPVIQELFEELTKPSTLRPLGLEDVLGWTADALNRVERAPFFNAFSAGDAVQYFYEPFLEAFDPDLRRQLGVWYTPREVVRYMVARVDAALRDELGIAEGLASDRVVVLDPCCGTGAYLVEVLNLIHQRYTDQKGAALAGLDTATAMRTRVFGFELLPAPFVVAHLQLGLLLTQKGAPLKDGQRAGIYLTNALTGWRAPDTLQPLLFSELSKERDAADAVKRDKPILVILGNPPYSGYAGLAIEEEASLTASYRTTQRAPMPQGQGLNDLYVRFFGMAERKISGSGRGVVCYVSNYSWLDGLSHTGMRERFLDTFDTLHIDNLHGDRKISEYAPDGRTSETIFAIQGKSVGIQVGTAITTLVKKSPKTNTTMAQVLYRDFDDARAEERRATLLRSLESPTNSPAYQSLNLVMELGYPLKPRHFEADYLSWPRLPELFPQSFPGVKTSRDDVLVDIDREKLEARMTRYFDPSVSDAQIAEEMPSVMRDGGRFAAKNIRATLIKRGFLPQNVVKYLYRPFDVRWVYWEPETKLLDEKRPEYFPHVQPGNMWLEARQRQTMTFDRGMLSTHLADNLGNGLSNYFPLYLYPTPKQRELFDAAEPFDPTPKPNLSERAVAYLGGQDPQTLFYHALAVLHAPRYRLENGGALRQDWPRLPLPTDRAALTDSAALGRTLAALLDPERAVDGVTHGAPSELVRSVAVLTVLAGGGAPDLAVRAGWGHFGAGSAVMPGRGRVTVDAATDTVTVWLNDTTAWVGVPSQVWEYTLGGYQVLKKWLSYRESRVLGRALRPEEAGEFMRVARRITALLALGEQLDANYARVRG